MEASISFDGTLSGSIAGGGGGGSDVSITPTYNQGKKIADYSIDGNEGAIYTPEIDITKYISSGVKLCEIEGVEIFAPSCGYIDTLGDSNVEQIGGFSEGLNVTPVKVKRVSYTNDVSNGEKIGSLTVGDTSYNVYQKPNTNINYSTTEQDTGRKWIDGRNIYQISFEESFSQGWTKTISNDSIKVVSIEAYAIYEASGVLQYIQLPYYYTNNDRCLVYVRNGVVAVDSVASFFQSYTKISCTIQYVKVVE